MIRFQENPSTTATISEPEAITLQRAAWKAIGFSYPEFMDTDKMLLRDFCKSKHGIQVDPVIQVGERVIDIREVPE